MCVLASGVPGREQVGQVVSTGTSVSSWQAVRTGTVRKQETWAVCMVVVVESYLLISPCDGTKPPT